MARVDSEEPVWHGSSTPSVFVQHQTRTRGLQICRKLRWRGRKNISQSIYNRKRIVAGQAWSLASLGRQNVKLRSKGCISHLNWESYQLGEISLGSLPDQTLSRHTDWQSVQQTNSTDYSSNFLYSKSSFITHKTVLQFLGLNLRSGLNGVSIGKISIRLHWLTARWYFAITRTCYVPNLSGLRSRWDWQNKRLTICDGIPTRAYQLQAKIACS